MEILSGNTERVISSWNELVWNVKLKLQAPKLGELRPRDVSRHRQDRKRTTQQRLEKGAFDIRLSAFTSWERKVLTSVTCDGVVAVGERWTQCVGAATRATTSCRGPSVIRRPHGAAKSGTAMPMRSARVFCRRSASETPWQRAGRGLAQKAGRSQRMSGAAGRGQTWRQRRCALLAACVFDTVLQRPGSRSLAAAFEPPRSARHLHAISRLDHDTVPPAARCQVERAIRAELRRQRRQQDYFDEDEDQKQFSEQLKVRPNAIPCRRPFVTWPPLARFAHKIGKGWASPPVCWDGVADPCRGRR